ncbi:MAG: hypothetical protein VR73_11835 [Gammaproteobacteria bacterium BRH_c0]|nr:MAG: hypothetical protein VR73_11835 [Gammaproteobacteria bacterium BRH_c0]
MGEKKKKTVGKKDAQLIIRISKEERKAFVDLCEELDTSAAREIRRFMRDFVASRSPGEELGQG